ncbi:unnamed protein product [Didymodactylos carnosus]|uniref:Uncharacterized protein n=1 Tax=Didymodactylos carnosus TaxID=1234261 RepID=A0A815GRY8_9BILA|nr:unnamed protein product [Didymodactylos carnosus]CAF1343875.1 unnamed protein product [Didymodactylos carnosus]CAF4139345.1 unnamed protein product [Didymodactylos carnosus]CAF4207700.1 unnamed protein product [Didymodactylos carnosus]
MSTKKLLNITVKNCVQKRSPTTTSKRSGSDISTTIKIRTRERSKRNNKCTVISEDEKNNEDFTVIWLEKHTTDDYSNRKADIRHLINYIKTFTNIDQCKEYLSNNRNQKVLFVVTGVLGETTIPLVHEQSNIMCIYVYCENMLKHQDWAKNFKKIRGVFDSKQLLIDALTRDVTFLINQLTPVSVFSMNSIKEKSLENINKQEAKFMWFQLLIEILFRMSKQDDTTARSDMIEECLK